ncbi:MAG TPA: radical SAM protein [Desulfobacterales bacterium]|nr:radical SAM protein [Desulfobacterales bacterium]
MLESIYYSISWVCRRACPHCYDERFKPYPPPEAARLTDLGRAVFPRVVGHLPETMRYTDLEDQQPDGGFRRKAGRIVLSGGEVLLEPVRTRVLHPLLEMLSDRYRDTGGVRLVVQTAGDLLTPAIVQELLSRQVWMISVSSVDEFHLRPSDLTCDQYRERLTQLFESAGMRPSGLQAATRKWTDEEGPVYSFFGATPDAWIGKLWPSGRAWANGLSTARYQDNFCNAWSGGLNFLNVGFSGSEVAVDPDGNLYPCCRKTRLAYGNLCEEPLLAILASLAGRPEFEAVTCGHPERMGLSHGLGVEEFVALSRVTDPAGRRYANRCIGCDAVHDRHLGPVLARLREARRSGGCG